MNANYLRQIEEAGITDVKEVEVAEYVLSFLENEGYYNELIGFDDDISDAWDVDSLDRVELIVQLEQAFNIEITDEESSAKTFKELTHIVYTKR